MKLAVVGAGLAGAAAVHRAARLGMQVTWINSGSGASSLGSGAADLTPWQSAPSDEPLPREVHDFNRDFNLWKLSEQSCLVVSATGVIRPARAVDPVTLDLRRLRGKVIGVAATAAHTSWALALNPETLNKAVWAQQSKTRFLGFDLSAANTAENTSAPEDYALGDVNLAAAMASAPRLEALASAMQTTMQTCRAASREPIAGWLLPASWVSSIREQTFLQQRLNVPVGVTLSDVGGPAGPRLAAQLAAWTDPAVTRLAQRVVALKRASRADRDGIELQLEAPPSANDTDATELFFDACVLALGGVASGGITLSSARRFQLSLDVPGAEIHAQTPDGWRPADVSAKAGIDFCATGARALDHVGIATGPNGKIHHRLYAAGDVVARSRLTALSAVLSGIAAVAAIHTER